MEGGQEKKERGRKKEGRKEKMEKNKPEDKKQTTCVSSQVIRPTL
jgi:hypothetical protein